MGGVKRCARGSATKGEVENQRGARRSRSYRASSPRSLIRGVRGGTTVPPSRQVVLKSPNLGVGGGGPPTLAPRSRSPLRASGGKAGWMRPLLGPRPPHGLFRPPTFSSRGTEAPANRGRGAQQRGSPAGATAPNHACTQPRKSSKHHDEGGGGDVGRMWEEFSETLQRR